MAFFEHLITYDMDRIGDWFHWNGTLKTFHQLKRLNHLKNILFVIHSVKMNITIAKMRMAITLFTRRHLNSSRCAKNGILFSFSSDTAQN